MTPREFLFHAKSEDDTARLGRALADALPEGCAVALNGMLGAGKTRLVKSIVAALGIDAGQVVSPTFVLIQPYEGRRTVCHIDAYRIQGAAELAELGIEELLSEYDLTFIEWAERIADALPEDCVEIDITVEGPEARLFRIACRGACEGFLEKLAAVL